MFRGHKPGPPSNSTNWSKTGTESIRPWHCLVNSHVWTLVKIGPIASLSDELTVGLYSVRHRIWEETALQPYSSQSSEYTDIFAKKGFCDRCMPSGSGVYLTHKPIDLLIVTRYRVNDITYVLQCARHHAWHAVADPGSHATYKSVDSFGSQL